MLGAIIGDIVGSPYEFHNIATTEFDLFGERSSFTDDTVMTLAVAQAFMDSFLSHRPLDDALIASMQKYGRIYPHAGYGYRFSNWLASDDPRPYNSFGNGSAMRVSSVAWLFDTLPSVERYAAITARVTHDHPEGIKGAQATAAAIFLARKGNSKADIRSYVENTYGYNLEATVENIRPTYHFDETCQGSVPQAMICFLESRGFEDCIRKSVSLGGDSDTIAAISGSIAEGYYGIPEELKREAMGRLDELLQEVVMRWHKNLPHMRGELRHGREL